jgi:hypothetical protein
LCWGATEVENGHDVAAMVKRESGVNATFKDEEKDSIKFSIDTNKLNVQIFIIYISLNRI